MAHVSLLLAGNASAYGCYEAACVPNVVIGATEGAPCPALNLSAQGADGIALQCGDQCGGDLRWVHRVDIPG